MKIVFTSLFLMLATSMSAYDFSVDGIYYNQHDNTVEVTSGTSKYTGDIIIPEKVEYEGKSYSVTGIGYCAFVSCNGITSVSIPSSVKNIGDEAFYGCLSLTSITIPSSVTSIGDDVFTWCNAMTTMSVAEDNQVFDSRNNCNAIIETSSNKLIRGCKNTVIPNTVTSIWNGAFWLCETLTTITIPASVTSIGIDAFNGCSGLTSVYNYAVTPQEINRYIFEKAYGATLYVLTASVDKYKAAVGWKEFSHIVGVGSPAAIESVSSMNTISSPAYYYDLSGRQSKYLSRGINIIKEQDGVRKVMVK